MKTKKGFFEQFAEVTTRGAGSSWALVLAFVVILAWLVSGPFFHFSDTWQLVINTGTTVVTFLMVFLLQRAQNKESLAIQLKLNELIAAVQGARNRLIDIEDLSEDEALALHEQYRKLAERVAGTRGRCTPSSSAIASLALGAGAPNRNVELAEERNQHPGNGETERAAGHQKRNERVG